MNDTPNKRIEHADPQARKWVKCKTDGCQEQIRPRHVRPAEFCRKCKKKIGRRRYYYDEKGAEVMWRANLRNKFGMTVGDYDRMLLEQNGVCKICKLPQSRARNTRPDRMCIDHCHSSDIIRGLLCSECNCLLGYAKDNTQTLLDAVEYILTASDQRTEILEKANCFKRKGKGN